MTLPKNLNSKILNRFDELIQEGQSIYDGIRVEPGKVTRLPTRFQGALRESPKTIIDEQACKKWTVNFRSLLDHVLPQGSIHRQLLEDQKTFFNSKHRIENQLAALQAIREDFDQGFLEDITLQIETEIAADYMKQAENLLSENQSGQFDHVPAAVLSGAVLEKELRTLCSKQIPPISSTKLNNKTKKEEPLTLNPLIDELKKARVFNELKAKQLRAWADIRNAAAHGEFQKFQRSDVEQMLKGINDFLSSYMT